MASERLDPTHAILEEAMTRSNDSVVFTKMVNEGNLIELRITRTLYGADGRGHQTAAQFADAII